MIGDQVVPKPFHTEAARQIAAMLLSVAKNQRIGLTVAGESGSGKSEIAVELKRFFGDANIAALILQQDDYFLLPPKSNEDKRRHDIAWVGMAEVKLDVLNNHIGLFKERAESIEKPLVVFEENRITKEIVHPDQFQIVIAEGTYTSTLTNADTRIFIDRTYSDTLSHRRERGRDTLDKFSEEVLDIEHRIISKHKTLAQIIVNNDYSVTQLTP